MRRATGCLLAFLLGVARSFQPASLRDPRSRARVVLTALEPSSTPSDGMWDERELWALEDCVPRYSLDSGRLVLWERMALDVPEFVTRSADELRACWLDPPMPLQKGDLVRAAVKSPPRLEQWERLEDGSVRGVLFGVSGVRDGCVRATVDPQPPAEGSSLAEAEQWCIRTRDGDVFQLGLEAPEASDLAPTLSGARANVGAVATVAGEAGKAALPAVAATAATFAAPAAVAALIVGGVLVATNGHLHLPHLDINVFLV